MHYWYKLKFCFGFCSIKYDLFVLSLTDDLWLGFLKVTVIVVIRGEYFALDFDVVLRVCYQILLPFFCGYFDSFVLSCLADVGVILLFKCPCLVF